MKLEKAITEYEAAGNAAYSKLLESMAQEKTKELIFVVVAMNRDEAQELLDEDAAIVDLLNQAELTRFQEFKTAFKQEFDSDAKTTLWLEHYQDRREEWRPHLYPPAPENAIVTLIEQESIKQYKRIKTANLPVKQHFWPNFVEAEDFFSQDAGADNDEGGLIDAWSGLQARSVLAIDGFSLFHPRIRKVLELSPFLSKNDPLAALIFSPLREQIPLHPLEISLEDTLRADM
ncbi:MAG: hypothetical protein GY801_31915, partial [bacterium]|nr:hypothetical protein [bacterium]